MHVSTYASTYSKDFGFSPLIVGAVAVGSSFKLVAGVQLSRTIYNALSPNYIPEITFNASATSRVKNLQKNLNLLKQLQQLGFNFLNKNVNIIELVAHVKQVTVEFNSFMTAIEPEREAGHASVNSTVSDDNCNTHPDMVFLYMCEQLMEYNKAQVTQYPTKSDQFVHFMVAQLPFAITYAEKKKEFFESVFGFDFGTLNDDKELNVKQQNVIIMTNLLSESKSIFDYANVTSMSQLNHIALVSQLAMNAALNCSMDFFKMNCDKVNSEFSKSPQFNDAANFRKFKWKTLDSNRKSIIEHVQVSIPYKFFDTKLGIHDVSEFVIKTHYEFAQYMKEEKACSTLQGITGIPTLYSQGSEMANKLQLILEYVGEPCTKRSEDTGRYFTAAQLIEVCEIVQGMHSKLQVHNDLKPSNITKMQNKLYIIDFECTNYHGYASQGFTRYFIAPERINLRKEELLPSYYASDVFSLGMIFACNVS